jgi:hypothetical protein
MLQSVQQRERGNRGALCGEHSAIGGRLALGGYVDLFDARTLSEFERVWAEMAAGGELQGAPEARRK